MDKKQLRDMIKEVLMAINLYSEDAVELLMFTAAVESNLGYYFKQTSGPARGIFQMEPATEGDLWKNFIEYKKDLKKSLLELFPISPINHLLYNVAYQIAMTRIHYLRKPGPLPSGKDVNAMAEYWKKHYNTPLGKGEIKEAIDKYNKYVLN